MVGHVDAHRRVVAGDQARGGGLAGGDLNGGAQHQFERGLQLRNAREVADLAGASGEARVAGRGAGDEPKRRPKLGLPRLMALGHGGGQLLGSSHSWRLQELDP